MLQINELIDNIHGFLIEKKRLGSFRKMFPLLKKYRWQIVISLFAMAFLSITDLLAPRQIQTIIDQWCCNRHC